MGYQIGNPITGVKEDEKYEEIEDAEEAAIKASIDDALWGVWDEETDMLVSLAFGCVLFFKLRCVMKTYMTYQETDNHLKQAVIDHLRFQFREPIKAYPIKDLLQHFNEQGIDITGHWVAIAIRGTRYTIRTRGLDGKRCIVLVDSTRYFASRIVRDEERDASISFGLTVSIHRVERHADKKIVPFEMQIRWFFWTWRQVITVFL